MKHLCHLVIIVCSTCIFASPSLGQQGNGGAASLLSLSANVTPASILELSSKSNNAEVITTDSTIVRSVRVSLQDPDVADVVKQTGDGTLVLTRIEMLVRFSGYKEETATVVITVTDADNSVSRDSLREGATEETTDHLSSEQIKLEGIRSGARIVRYVGFLTRPKGFVATNKTHFGAVLTYQIIHP